MALDIGDARVGVAISDADGRVSTPLKVLPAILVCGLPYTMSGEEGPQAASIRKRAQAIAQACRLPLEFIDERMSSSQAKRILREEGLDERAMRGKVDMIAASIFLQTWLDSRSGVSARD